LFKLRSDSLLNKIILYCIVYCIYLPGVSVHPSTTAVCGSFWTATCRGRPAAGPSLSSRHDVASTWPLTSLLLPASKHHINSLFLLSVLTMCISNNILLNW